MIVARAEGWEVAMESLPNGRIKTTIKGPEEPPLILYFRPEVLGLITAMVNNYEKAEASE